MFVFNAAWATSRSTCPMYNTKRGCWGGGAWHALVHRQALAFSYIAEAPQKGWRRKVNTQRRLAASDAVICFYVPKMRLETSVELASARE